MAKFNSKATEQPAATGLAVIVFRRRSSLLLQVVQERNEPHHSFMDGFLAGTGRFM